MLAIIGCGDVGRRILPYAQSQNIDRVISSCSRSENLVGLSALGTQVFVLDLDQQLGSQTCVNLSTLHGCKIIYTIAPQPDGETDSRSKRLIQALKELSIRPSSIVLISTTAVYGDCQGRWIDESEPTAPKTPRGYRRVSAERQWQVFADTHSLSLTILRVPGIYAKSRLPLERINRGDPVLRESECGYSNRIHAEDLARICLKATELSKHFTVLNVSDGKPGTLTGFYQTVANQYGLKLLQEINLTEAKQRFSDQLLSYYLDSRRIKNTAMLAELEIDLEYPDFIEGMKY